ncbi:MAG TPA: hypothetical protein VGQ83_22420 [Polyangia bacterium]|jgi:hypothetical protein
MTMLKGVVAWVVMAVALAAAPQVARAATAARASPREIRVVTEAVPGASAGDARAPSRAELRRYAEREAAAPGLRGFEGGQVIYITAGVIFLAALVTVLILVLV